METVRVAAGLYVCGYTPLEPVEEVVAAARAAGVRHMVALGMTPDPRLAAALRRVGVEYQHLPMRGGRATPAFRRVVMGKLGKLVTDGGALLSGETAGGPVLRMAREMAGRWRR